MIKMGWMSALLVTASAVSAAPKQPNVLWIITDDHRYDSIRAFNKIMTGKGDSELGYVESPNTDKLVEQGTTFINSFCHAQGCAPSRASMHYGRYPFRSGIYEFEWFNNEVTPKELSVPEVMAKQGYQTFHVGKLGVRVRTHNKQGNFTTHKIYQQDVNFHKMWDEGFVAWKRPSNPWGASVSEVNGVKLDSPVYCEWMKREDGGWDYMGEALTKIPALKGYNEKMEKKYDILRKYPSKSAYKEGKGEVIGGFTPLSIDETRDGAYTYELIKFLENPNKPLKVGTKDHVGSQSYRGVNPNKPLYVNIGYDFPHTPVLPAKEIRDRFAKIKYDIPEVDPDEFGKLPKQLQGLVKKSASDHYSDAEKQQMVQDYYAFCAHGDQLIGKAVDAFVKYSETNNQEYMIVYVCGDHGWRLNEHGSIYKFGPWMTDSLDPIVVVSSDKKRFPAGKVVTDLTELVDVAPTILAAGGADISKPEFEYLDGYDLAKVASGELPARDYIVGESHAVTGPRATIRTKEYMFSVKSRPRNKMGGKNMNWAMNASYEELEPVLYDMSKDPDELNNLAHNPEYKDIAMAMKEKLLNIVIGDDRREILWGKKGDGTEMATSNFAPDADDKKLKLP